MAQICHHLLKVLSSGNGGPAVPNCPLVTRGEMSRSAGPDGVVVGGLALLLLGHVGNF